MTPQVRAETEDGADRGEDAGNGAVPRDELRRSAEDILR